jgi:hypothetical protein
MRKGRAQNVDDGARWTGGDGSPTDHFGARQNGLITTRMTIPIMRIVGTSLIMR